MFNRSVPVNTVLPHVVYRDLPTAIDWLIKTLGFEENYRYGDPVQGAQLHLGGAYLMVRTARPGSTSPSQAGAWTQSVSIYVDDVDAHYRKTKSAGATIDHELQETIYGERVYGVVDPEGHPWEFSQHIRDIAPAEWGAKVARS
jgi:uncharacterized glyoxalase superfamily protein PhnB